MKNPALFIRAQLKRRLIQEPIGRRNEPMGSRDDVTFQQLSR